jgi:MFS family permease
LRQRSVAALITAEVISSLGSQMTFLALPLFVLATTGSATKMGIVLAVELAPVALLGIPSGTVVARLGARRTMLVGNLARAPLMASVPILYSLGALSFGLLLALVALLASSSLRTSPRSDSCCPSSSARTSASSPRRTRSSRARSGRRRSSAPRWPGC